MNNKEFVSTELADLQMIIVDDRRSAEDKYDTERLG